MEAIMVICLKIFLFSYALAEHDSEEGISKAGEVLIYLFVSFCVCDPRDKPTLPCVSSLAGFSSVGSSLRPS